MRAVVVRSFGGPEVLVAEDTLDPEPGPGDALVDVTFACVTFVETQIRAGLFGSRPLPWIPGNGVGGTVVAVGAGVNGSWVGRSVVATTGGSGGYAGRALVQGRDLVGVPDGMELADAVALLADGRTATLLRDAAGETAGRRVLVLAAGGGVGSLLVQSTVRDAAEVVGAAGGGPKEALIGSLGATYADYRRAGWEQRVGPVDVLFDGVGGDAGTAATTLVRPGGRVLRYGFAGGADSEPSAERLEALGVSVSVLAGAPAPERNLVLIRRALDLAVAGAWRPLVGQVVPLESASEAHARIESRRTFGKTLLDAR